MPYETIPIDLQNKPPEFLEVYARANPIPDARAKVPVLEIIEGENENKNNNNAVVLTESLVLTDYLADRYPSAGLMPDGCEDRAVVRLFSELCGSATFSYWGILRAKRDEAAFASAVAGFTEGLVHANAFLEARGDPDGPFLFGDRFTLAECNSAPFVQRACNVLPACTGEGGSEIVDPLKICEDLGLTRLKRWMEAVVERPSVKHLELSRDEMMQSVTKMLKRFEEMEKSKQQ